MHSLLVIVAGAELTATVQALKHFMCSATDIQITKHGTNFKELDII